MFPFGFGFGGPFVGGFGSPFGFGLGLGFPSSFSSFRRFPTPFFPGNFIAPYGPYLLASGWGSGRSRSCCC
jgi:hypothetical protein